VKRLLSTIGCDFRLQVRNGFYHAAAVVVAMVVLLFTQVPASGRAALLPIVVLSNVLVNAFYFVAGLVLLEKGEGTLEVQVITPLRRWEYLASKTATLTVLSLAESGAIAVVSVGAGCNWPLLLAGTALLSVLLTLFGFAAVARYDSINEFILPSAVVTVALCVPMLTWFEVADSALFYLHPIHAPLLLLRAAFQPVAPWQMAYGVLYGGLWIGLMMRVCLRVFYRFIIAGTRAV